MTADHTAQTHQPPAGGTNSASVGTETEYVLLTERCTSRSCSGRTRYSELTDDDNTHWHTKPGVALVSSESIAAARVDAALAEVESRMRDADLVLLGHGKEFDLDSALDVVRDYREEVRHG